MLTQLIDLISGESQGITSAPPRHPARVALHTKLAEIAACNERRSKLTRDIGEHQRNVLKLALVQADLEGLQRERDQAIAYAEYAEESAPDLSALEAQAQKLRLILDPVAKCVRDGELIAARLGKMNDALVREIATLQSQADELLVGAVEERMVATAPALAEAESRYRAVLRSSFIAAVALQQVTRTQGRPRNLGCRQYGDTFLPKPTHVAFGYQEFASDLEKGRALAEKHKAYQEDVATIDQDANDLIDRILRSEC